jgi:hypothetical protein
MTCACAEGAIILLPVNVLSRGALTVRLRGQSVFRVSVIGSHCFGMHHRHLLSHCHSTEGLPLLSSHWSAILVQIRVSRLLLPLTLDSLCFTTPFLALECAFADPLLL